MSLEGTVISDGGHVTPRYRLIRFLREGGFGSVYEAKVIGILQEDVDVVRSSSSVAVKAIQKDKLCDEKLKTVKNEIRIQSRLEHDHVAKLLDCFESESHVFIILEYFGSGDLEVRLHEHGPFPEEAARRILAQLCSGIGYLHKNHILHRDLKLANVLLSHNNNRHDHEEDPGGVPNGGADLDPVRVALCDFGLAVNVQSSENTRRTLCGTPNSISPEVISQVNNSNKLISGN